MLCCVSRGAIAEADQGPPYDHCSTIEQLINLKEIVQVEQSRESDVPPILLPCAICARTFMPQSLDKHSKICERSANKKRKPFDSAKQRIQGTELAEFLPKQEKKRRSLDDKLSNSKSTWKQTHDDFLRAIRAARNEIADSTMQKQSGTTIISNAPTRANEQGMCPTCNRHFGVKAYDRHVAWCKERITRAPVSPATNIAKERLEARMKYRAPVLKSRRQATREKYSTGSAITLSSGSKTLPTLAANNKAKESASAPSCNKTKDNPAKQKSTVVRRLSQTRESSSPTVPMKSRLIDRMNRPLEDEAGPVTFRPAPPVKRTSHLPVPPLKHKKESFEECDSVPLPRSCSKQSKKTRGTARQDKTTREKTKQDERHQSLHSARSLKSNIVSARSQGNPKLNDISINDDIMGVTVKSCIIYRENQLITWKQLVETNQAKDLKESIEDLCLNEKQMENVEFALSVNVENTNRSTASTTLNQTYSCKDSLVSDKTDDMHITRSKKWKPVRHSPRVEFCLGDLDRMSHIYTSSINSVVSEEANTTSDSRNSCTNLKLGTLKTNVSKHSVIKDEGTMNKVRSREDNFYFETSDAISPSESFKSSRDRILEKKQLKPIASADSFAQDNFEDNAENSCNNFKVMHSQKNLCENSDIRASNANVPIMKGTGLLDCKNLQAIHANESVGAIEGNIKGNILPLFEENLPSSVSYGQFADICKISESEKNKEIANSNMQEANQEIIQLTFRNDQPNNEWNERKYIKTPDNDNDELDIDTKNSIQLVQSQCEYSTRNENINNDAFHNSETNWVEMETDPLDTDVMLQPTRSSTPFINIENYSELKCEDCENLKKELCLLPENSEWRVEIDTQTGSEMLYRVESRHSNSLNSRHSSRGKIGKSEKINFAVSPSNDRHNECNKTIEGSSTISSPIVQRERKILSRDTCSLLKKKGESFLNVTSPVRKEEQIEFPKVRKKEIANQINICNCPAEVSLNFKCENNVGEASVNINENSSHSEGQVCDTLLNTNVLADNLMEESSEAQSRIKFSESNYNCNLTESLASHFGANLRKDDCCYKSEYTVIENNNNNSKNTSNIFEKSAVKKDVISEEVQEIYKNCSIKEFDCDSDNSIERRVQDNMNNFKSVSDENDRTKQNCRGLRSIVLSESCFRLSQRVRLHDSLINRSTALKSRRSKTIDVENMSILNESSDSLASSVDGVDLTDVKQVESVEVETIEEIGTRNRSIRFRILPEIKGRMITKKNCNEKEKIDNETYWEKASKASKNRLINLDPPHQEASRFLKRNPKFRIFPSVPSNPSLICHSGRDYDPFLLAEQQMNDLLSDTSEQSVTDIPPIEQNQDSSFPLSHSSAFVRYPCQPSLSSPEKRSSLIAPPSEFDDLASDFSSDSTETNSLSQEAFLKDLKENKEFKGSIRKTKVEKKSPVRELGRRIIIDKSKALGGEAIDAANCGDRSFVGNSEGVHKILDKVSTKVIRPNVNRSVSVRSSSASKTTPDRKNSNNSHEKRSFHKNSDIYKSSNNSLNGRNNNYTNLSSSNLSLSSIISSDVDIKRSNSVFDELMTSFENENSSFPSLKSFMKSDSLSVCSPVHGRQRNGQISDEELSSPENYKRQDYNKMSADSAYSSLNRKYSHHGRSTNDVVGCFDEDLLRNNRRDSDGVATKCKMSKYCHRCGFKFPETAKFCCECGIKRLVL